MPPICKKGTFSISELSAQLRSQHAVVPVKKGGPPPHSFHDSVRGQGVSYPSQGVFWSLRRKKRLSPQTLRHLGGKKREFLVLKLLTIGEVEHEGVHNEMIKNKSKQATFR